ncbi:MAG: cysteine desulfurase [Planctomycetales bacterium]|nr:cysteine desulfurase [Planctomycetales bacterium]
MNEGPIHELKTVSMPTYYLDHNATTPLAPRALAAMNEAWSAGLGNASSQHGPGQQAAQDWRRWRDEIIGWLGGRTDCFPADQLIVTSGGTESNHLALWGLVDWHALTLGSRDVSPDNLVLSAMEHPSVGRSAAALAERFGLELRLVKPDRAGRIEAAELLRAVDDRTRLVSLMLAHNETGVIQPVKEVADACRARGIPVHCDAAQAVGKIAFSFRELSVTALSFAAHKFHGPLGIGGLLIESGRSLKPTWFGGFQQQGVRPGTEPLPLLAGMHAALGWYLEHQAPHVARLRQLRDSFESTLRAGCPEAVFLGADRDRLPNTSLVAFPGLDRQALVMAAGMAGVACSSGSACASGSSEPSPTLLAMGVAPTLIGSAVRFSFGALQEPTEGDEAARLILNAVNNLSRWK